MDVTDLPVINEGGGLWLGVGPPLPSLNHHLHDMLLSSSYTVDFVNGQAIRLGEASQVRGAESKQLTVAASRETASYRAGVFWDKRGGTLSAAVNGETPHSSWLQQQVGRRGGN